MTGSAFGAVRVDTFAGRSGFSTIAEALSPRCRAVLIFNEKVAVPCRIAPLDVDDFVRLDNRTSSDYYPTGIISDTIRLADQRQASALIRFRVLFHWTRVRRAT